MRKVLKIILVCILVLFIAILVYLNVMKYSTINNNVFETNIDQENTSEKENSIYVYKVVNSVHNIAMVETVPESSYNSTNANTNVVIEFDENLVQEYNNNIANVVIESNDENTDIYYTNDPSLVILNVVEDVVTNESGVTLEIFDNNELHYKWRKDYFEIEEKVGDDWKEASRIREKMHLAIAYGRDDSYPIIDKINWKNDYGELSSGTYRIVKYIGDIKFVSDEFIIE